MFARGTLISSRLGPFNFFVLFLLWFNVIASILERFMRVLKFTTIISLLFSILILILSNFWRLKIWNMFHRRLCLSHDHIQFIIRFIGSLMRSVMMTLFLDFWINSLRAKLSFFLLINMWWRHFLSGLVIILDRWKLIWSSSIFNAWSIHLPKFRLRFTSFFHLLNLFWSN